MDVKQQGQGNECSTDVNMGLQEKAWNRSSLEIAASQLVLIHQPNIFSGHRETYQTHKSPCDEQQHSLRTCTCSHPLYHARRKATSKQKILLLGKEKEKLCQAKIET